MVILHFPFKIDVETEKKILKTIDDLGLHENTYVYFTSDHGAHIDIGPKGGSNWPFKGGKGMGAIEGGIRVPGIVRWPKKQMVMQEREISLPITLMDFLPTLKEIVEEESDNVSEIRLPNSIDGKSFLSLLNGQKESSHTFIRHYCGSSVHALRFVTNGNIYKAWFKRPLLNSDGHCGEGKLCSCFGDSDSLKDFGCDPEIFDLVQDPTEETAILKTSEIYNDLKRKFIQEYIRINANTTNLSECYKDTAYIDNNDMKLPLDNNDVQSQYTYFFDVMPRPWMQPCSRFPRCSTK